MKLNLIKLKGHNIYDQLKLEESLLRTSDENWCLINEGSPLSIVMGISGQSKELVEESCAKQDGVPIIRRFSGGGTVVVDSGTLFVSLIFQEEAHPFPSYPEPILRWTEEFYQSALSIPSFKLRENDYVIGNLKCGGNAQYLRKNNWLHHTTFLWDFQKQNMNYLKHPLRMPKYRKGRSHLEFLCTLKKFYPQIHLMSNKIQEELQHRFILNEPLLSEVNLFLKLHHRKSTQIIG